MVKLPASIMAATAAAAVRFQFFNIFISVPPLFLL
jgi:hypothetical protein